MELEGVQLVAVDSLDVMGLKMKVGMSVYELVSPLAARAREKFWAVKYIYIYIYIYILRSKGHVKERVRVMDRIISATALWCISCIGPDKAAMSMLKQCAAAAPGMDAPPREKERGDVGGIPQAGLSRG